jgi:hypothetical protein
MTPTTGRLYTVRQLDGLTTTSEEPRLFDWQAVEALEKLDVAEPKALVERAAESGSGLVATSPGRSILVLSSPY